MDCRRRIKRPRLEFQQGKSSNHCGHQNAAELQFIRGRSALPVINSVITKITNQSLKFIKRLVLMEISCCEAKELTLTRIKSLLGNLHSTNKGPWKHNSEVKTFLDKLTQIMGGYDDYVNSEEFKEKRRLEAEEDKIRKVAEMQEDEERAKKVLMEKVMLNHLISKEIFQYLSVKDLLNLSLVCKSFYEPSRKSLSRDKKCYIEMNWINSCDKLSKLTSLLNTCKIIPFNGLNVVYSCSHSCFNHGDKAELHADLILTHLTNIKYLKLLEWPVFKDCPVFYIIRNLLTRRSRNLIEISLGTISQIGSEDLSSINGLLASPLPPSLIPGSSSLPSPSSSDTPKASSNMIDIENLFPNVKKLTIPSSGLTDNIASLVREFISASPNLEKIIGCVVPKLTPPLIQNKKVAIVKEFRFAYLTTEEVNISLNFAQAGSRIQKLIVDSSASRFSTSLGTLRDSLRALYEASQDSLLTLHISHADLLMFLGPLMPSLTNTTELHLSYNNQFDQLQFPILGKINFKSKFPNLESVIVDRANTTRFFSDRNDLRQWANQSDYSSTSVSRIKFNDNRQELSLVTPFSKIFTNVTYCHINYPTGFPDLLSKLWTAWPNLISLTILKISNDLISSNFDSDFTGISVENCRTMRETGNYDNYKLLKVKPAITDLKRLKLLRLHIDHESWICKANRPREPFLTQVTAKCAFGPMLLLTVLISVNQCQHLPKNSDCQFALNDIINYAHIVPATLNIIRDWNSI